MSIELRSVLHSQDREFPPGRLAHAKWGDTSDPGYPQPQAAEVESAHLLANDARPEGYFKDSLAIRMGGRVAEQLVFGQSSTGAANDLAGATDLATRMVREFGMSPTLGPVGFASGSPMFLGGEEVRSRPYAEATQRVIDQGVAKLIREAEDRATAMLSDHRDALERLTELLLERETVDGTDVDGVLGRIPGHPQPIGATGHTATSEGR